MADAKLTIGVSTGGGDAPGLNAVIRAVVRCATERYGWRVLGIRNGFDGLIWPEQCCELTRQSIRGILPRGGTIIGTTNRGNPFRYATEEDGATVHRDYSLECMQNWKRLGLDAMVVIGGDGTLAIANEFQTRGIPVVGVPKTIDNDLSSTDVTFGFDTALHVATDAIDRLHTTAESHHRVMVVEVMGRDAGWIALHAGIAGGVHVILIPEIPFTIENVCAAIRRRDAIGRNFSVVVVAEGVRLPATDGLGRPFPGTPVRNPAVLIGNAISEVTGKDVRVTILGHVQRGGSPSPFDRILATRFGVAAVDLIARGEFGRMVCLRGTRIESVPLAEAIGITHLVDPASDRVQAARSVGISFGDAC
ncbi:MAG TPA: ATP-dependent 6-phosphofructokinase [Candidatus Solibacter sp.]|nr:ATP-dependent 6-phosphofructokinase [Candidatus Solibacter sp.]